MLTVKQVQEILGCSRSGVYNLIRRAEDPLPAYKVGAIRIDRNELSAWLKRQRFSEVAA